MTAASLTVALVLVVGALPPQTAPVRIETAEALAQIERRVEPVVPQAAAAARIGGDVIADVTVGLQGTVTAVTVVGGHEKLHAAAIAALKQWQFKPFLRRGKPVAVQVILEVAFPDPVREEERRAFDEHRAAERRCVEAMDRDPVAAPTVCAEVIPRSAALPKDRVPERSHAYTLHANSLIRAGRPREAIGELERAIELRDPVDRPADAVTADGYHAIGLLQQQTGNITGADTAFSTAVRMYEGALRELPQMRDLYLPRLQRALQSYSALKRQAGEADAAAALEARLEALPAAAPRPDPSRRSRTAGHLQLLEPTASPLPDAEVQNITAALAATGAQAWMLAHYGPSERPQRGAEWFVEGYLAPALVTPTARRGDVVFVVRRTREGASGHSARWQVEKMASFWVQLALGGGDPAAEFPIKVQPAPNEPSPQMAAIVDLVRLVRARPDVKAWPIDSINYWRGGATIHLEDHATRATQSLTLRREGSAWTISDIRTSERNEPLALSAPRVLARAFAARPRPQRPGRRTRPHLRFTTDHERGAHRAHPDRHGRRLRISDERTGDCQLHAVT